MNYRKLGRSGIKVSPLCLGTMMFGGPTDEATSRRIIARAAEAGVNFIDTADGYNKGRSEEVVGRAIREQRDRWVVATKVFTPMGEGPNGRGASRLWLMRAAEASLRRLGLDAIDIWYLHKEDLDTPLDETVRALADLVHQGKIRYFGVSNFRAWRVAEICRLCDELGIDRPVVSQPYYSAVNRAVEVEHLPACGYYGLGVFPYSPVARGVLSGKYTSIDDAPKDSRVGRGDRRVLETEWRPETLAVATRMKAHADARGISAAQLAVAWVLNNALVTGAIAGPRTEAQWEDYLGALDYRFSAEDEALVDGLVAPGHPAAPGYNDPTYPIEGRVPRS